jgi:parvulin-like peptidyl-prolyl isomerase
LPLVLLAPALWAAEAPREEGELVNAVVAIVNNEAVTKLEVDMLVAEIHRNAESITPEQYRETWEKARDSMIEQQLLVQEARRLKIEIDPDEVNEEVQRLKKAGVKAAEDRRDVIRERFMVSRMLQQLATARAVSPQEIDDYYAKHPDEFVLRERRHVLLIGIYAQAFNDDMAAARKKAEEIREQLKKGEDFAALAKAHSNGPFAEKGGDQGWLEKGALVKSLDDAIFRLKAGECSDLVETKDGYLILKVAGVQPASRQSLAEARAAIARRLQDDCRQARRQQLVEQLKRTATIVRFDLYPKSATKP